MSAWGLLQKIRPKTRVIRTMAVRMRFMLWQGYSFRAVSLAVGSLAVENRSRVGELFVRLYLSNAAVAAVAALEFNDAFEQMQAAEVRPEEVGDVKLRVGNLPEEEVGDAHFA